jgi:ribosomal protein S18 acetylase RimI-like enzyme
MVSPDHPRTMTTEVTLRLATDADREAVWTILEPTIRAGETYALPRDMSREAALAWWFANEVWVAVDRGAIAGTYLIHANQLGSGSHVANCGYMTAASSTGKGIARAMCAHSLDRAKQLGFRAMQFNFVVSTNTRAVALWKAMGFAIVGTLPGACAHPRLGDVDAYVMYRRL